MSVARCREINARLRAAGITVHEWSGWESRGNGQASAYEGGIVHHTGTDYGYAFQALVTGRPDLPGPLCNYATNEDGSITVIAAHPANHAGASGGRSMGPLSTTTLFNKRVLGNEIVYPGVSPMRDAQYRSALVWARVTADVVGFGDIERIRAHAETSITGKWDPGDGPGHTIDMRAFRAAALIQPEIDMDLDDIVGHTYDDPTGSYSLRTFIFGIHQHAKEADRKSQLLTAKVDALTNALSDDEANIIAAMREAVASIPAGDVDEAVLAAVLAPALAPFIQAGATPAQVEDAVRRVFASAGQAGGTQ